MAAPLPVTITLFVTSFPMNGYMFIALVMTLAVLPLAVYVMLKERTGFQKIWDLAMAGHKLARVYVVVLCFAFLLAVVGWMVAFSENREHKRAVAMTHNNSLGADTQQQEAAARILLRAGQL